MGGWRKILGGASLLFAVFVSAFVGACSHHADNAPCPADDPTTVPNEAECRALANPTSGGQAVQRRNCLTCHGNDMAGSTTPLPGYGKTALGEDIQLYPPNLTPDPTTGVAPPEKGGKWTDEALAFAIRNGVDADSEELCPQMTHFSGMSDFEVYSIILYLRQIPPVTKKIPRSVCPPLKTAAQQ